MATAAVTVPIQEVVLEDLYAVAGTDPYLAATDDPYAVIEDSPVPSTDEALGERIELAAPQHDDNCATTAALTDSFPAASSTAPPAADARLHTGAPAVAASVSGAGGDAVKASVAAASASGAEGDAAEGYPGAPSGAAGALRMAEAELPSCDPALLAAALDSAVTRGSAQCLDAAVAEAPQRGIPTWPDATVADELARALDRRRELASEASEEQTRRAGVEARLRGLLASEHCVPDALSEAIQVAHHLGADKALVRAAVERQSAFSAMQAEVDLERAYQAIAIEVPDARRIQALEQALQVARACGIHEDRLLEPEQAARVARHEARHSAGEATAEAQREALAGLVSLGSSTDPEELRAALDRATCCGLDHEALRPAFARLHALDALSARGRDAERTAETRRQAEERLARAADATSLTEAIAEAQAAGVDPEQISVALRRKAALQDAQKRSGHARLLARRLQLAMQGADVSALKSTLAMALKHGVEGAQLEAGRARLAELQGESASRVQAEEALDLARAGEDMALLSEAVVEAKLAGVEVAAVNRGQHRLSQLEVRASQRDTEHGTEKKAAAAALSEATNGRDLEALESTLAWAERVGAEAELLYPAVRLLEVLRAEAKDGEARQRVRAALRDAEATKLDERRREAEALIGAAWRERHPERFRVAIERARQVDLDSGRLVDACRALSVLEGELALERALAQTGEEALTRRALVAWLARAVADGMSPVLQDQVRARLPLSLAPSDAPARTSVGKLLRLAVPRPTAVLQAEADFCPWLQEAEARLASAGSAADLRAAIADARTAGVLPERTERAVARLVELERQERQARAQHREAMEGGESKRPRLDAPRPLEPTPSTPGGAARPEETAAAPGSVQGEELQRGDPIDDDEL